MKLADALARLFGAVDTLHNRGRSAWYRRGPFDRGWTIEAYVGFGNERVLDVGGRVLRRVAHRPPDASHATLRNVVEFIKRMESDELPGARVRVSFGDREDVVVADDEGHFRASVAATAPLDPGVHRVAFELVDPAPRRGRDPVRVDCDAIVPPPSARFGIVSDLDDTVVWSNAGNRLRMVAMLMRSNALTRKPFKGVAAFYRALHAGAGGSEANPLFYVSSSPWNLYTPLSDFLAAQELPRGPLMLKDFGGHMLFRTVDHRVHKRGAIERVLATYPALPFVLIGDSGEQDPEVYADVVRDHPGRVRAVYIRSVDPDPARIAAVDALIARVREGGVDLVLAPDSEAAARHAAATGLIAADALAAIRGEVVAEVAMPAPTSPDDV